MLTLEHRVHGTAHDIGNRRPFTGREPPHGIELLFGELDLGAHHAIIIAYYASMVGPGQPARRRPFFGYGRALPTRCRSMLHRRWALDDKASLPLVRSLDEQQIGSGT